MYFIVRDGTERHRLSDDPEYRKWYGRAREEFGHLSPREQALERRKAIKRMRFRRNADGSKRAMDIGESAALREMISAEVNSEPLRKEL